MGNCSTSQKAGISKRESEKRMVEQLTTQIDDLKERLLFAQALLKMGILSRLLRKQLQEEDDKVKMEKIMQLQIDMGRINQDVMSNHFKAAICFETALEYSNCLLGEKNAIASKFIRPLLEVSRSILQEAQSSLKPKINLNHAHTDTSLEISSSMVSSRKFIQRSQTHTTTRVTGMSPSLNVILEESFEHQNEEQKDHRKQRDHNQDRKSVPNFTESIQA